MGKSAYTAQERGLGALNENKRQNGTWPGESIWRGEGGEGEDILVGFRSRIRALTE